MHKRCFERLDASPLSPLRCHDLKFIVASTVSLCRSAAAKVPLMTPLHEDDDGPGQPRQCAEVSCSGNCRSLVVVHCFPTSTGDLGFSAPTLTIHFCRGVPCSSRIYSVR